MHINKIDAIHQNNNLNQKHNSTHFKGAADAAVGALNKFFQVCDDVPMIGVSFMDGASAIAPRTVVDLNQAGIPAAAETFRRESSGLVVNCLIPGAFVYGVSKLANNEWMKSFPTTNGKPVNLGRSWANGEAVENLVGVWKEFSGLKQDVSTLTGDAKEMAIEALNTKKFKGTGFIRSALGKIEGLNGTDNWEKLSDHKKLIEKAAEILAPKLENDRPTGFIEQIKYNRSKNQAIQNAYELLINGKYTYKDQFGKLVTVVVEENGGLKAAQNLKFNGKNISSNLKNFLRDTVDIGGALSSSKTARMNPDKFVKKASGLINTKSLVGIGLVLPLAMSMQYINRAITRHKYNKSGAPIYKDFENETRVLTDKEKKRLKIQKPLAVASIVGLAALSMGKSFPKSLSGFAKMLQFDTKFPSVNQCRVIATATFASRMMASEDPNELRESTVRDLVSFAGLYFLGDYAEKLTATAIQKFAKPAKEGKLQMFNRTKDPATYKNVFQKVKGWVKDTSIKSFDEIPKEYKGYRSLAKIGGLGFSIALLGVLLPMYNKHVTNKKEIKRKALLEQQKEHSIMYNPKEVFPSKEKTPEEVQQALILESKNKFNSMQDYANSKEFSKVASNFIH